MEDCLKLFKAGKCSADAVEDVWYGLMHCKPGKRTTRRVFQTAFGSHPISDGFTKLRAAAPTSMKPAISACLKYTKQWWSKSTDTYLFPSLAITLFLQSTTDSGYETIPLSSKQAALDIYNTMVQTDEPNAFTRYVVCSDQHTAAGASAGIGRDSPYAAPLFAMWGSAVRPSAFPKNHIFSDYIRLSVPQLPLPFVTEQAKNMVAFGDGHMSEEELWKNTLGVLRDGLGLMPPPLPPPVKATTVTYDDTIKHPDARAKFHFRHAIVPGGWPVDTIVSGLQKMIRRANLKHVLWMAAQLLSFALFHIETNSLWSIHPGAQAKVTNLLNRLLVIVAEDCHPNAALFISTSQHVESARGALLGLKDAQTDALYLERFGILCQHVFSTVAVLSGALKARVVDTQMRAYGKYYRKAEESVEVISKKRKQSVLAF
jgi:hypothetical protein